MILVSTDGLEKVYRRLNQIQVWADDGRLVKKGARAAVGAIAKAQRPLAPVRKGQTKRRALRKIKVGGTWQRPQGPQELIKPGQLKRAIRVSVRVSKKGELTAKAGLNVALKRLDKRRAPHGHLVTLGTKDRRTKSGAIRGKMKPNRFMVTGANAALPQAMAALEKQVAADLKKEVAALK